MLFLRDALGNMKDSESDHKVKSLEPADYIASLIKSIAGAVPFAGTFLTEIIGNVIPKQRFDRLADFAITLSHRLSEIEESVVVEKINEDRIGELVEEATRQAARSTSKERRGYLANLVYCSLTSSESQSNDERHLLRILGELNDKEIIWLRFYAVPWPHHDDFRGLHQVVLDTPFVRSDASEEIIRIAAFHESYNDHLISLGLLKQEISDDGENQPEFNRSKGRFELKEPTITPLGEMLLAHIGLHPEKNSRAVRVERNPHSGFRRMRQS